MTNISASEGLNCMQSPTLSYAFNGRWMEIELTVVYMTVQEAGLPASLAGKHDMSYTSICDCLIGANCNQRIYYGQQSCAFKRS